jgi:pimeloyl-ACP methyl ester carboxylesterase
MLESVVCLLEDKLSASLSKRSSMQKPLDKVTLTVRDPLFVVRPLLFYAAIRGMFWVGLGILHYLGFSELQISHPGVEVHYKRARKFLAFQHKPAIVLFHGLGIGLSIYARFIQKLTKDFPEQDIILFEMASISMRLDMNHVLPAEFAHLVSDTLSRIGVEKAIFIGHSLGSSCVRWMDIFHPELVAGRIFVDPICFLLWTHDIAYNAVARWPSNSHEAIIKWIAMCEPGISTYLHRHFVWVSELES